MGEIVRFPVTTKLLWYEQIALDREVSAVGFKIAFLLGWHTNRITGLCFPSMTFLAEEANVHISTVKRSIGELEARGHIRVHRRDLGTRNDGRRVSGGRTAHRYEPILKRRPSTVSLNPEKETMGGLLSEAERRPNRASKETKFRELGDHPWSPNPVLTHFKNPERRGRGSVTDAADRLITELEQQAPRRQALGEFELELAKHLDIQHVELIERCDEATLIALHRKMRAGADISHDVDDLRLKLAHARAERSQLADEVARRR